MFDSKEQLIEEVFKRVAPGQTQEVKGLTRGDIEACLPGAYVRLAEAVARSGDYYWLQRSLVCKLNEGRHRLNFPTVVHPTEGRRTGLRVVEGEYIPTAAGVYGVAAQTLVPDASGHITNCTLEWGYKSGRELLVALRPCELVDCLTSNAGDTGNSCAVYVNATGQIQLLQAGSIVYTMTMPVLANQRVQLEFDADGGIMLRILDSGCVVLYEEEAANFELIPKVCNIVFVWLGGTTTVVEPVLLRGVENVLSLPGDNRLLLWSVEKQGGVEFVNGDTEQFYEQPLTYVEDSSMRFLPRLPHLWYWTFDTSAADGATGVAVRVFPGDRVSEPPSEFLRVTGNVVPTWQDISDQLHEPLIAQVITLARERALPMMAKQAVKA